MKAVIIVDVPDYQMGQEVSVYFKDTMCIKSICKEDSTIAELEKIKAEIKSYEIRRKLEFTPNCRDCVFCTRDTFTDIYRTIDNHISKLKG